MNGLVLPFTNGMTIEKVKSCFDLVYEATDRAVYFENLPEHPPVTVKLKT